MTEYLSTTFSPAMLGRGVQATVKELSSAELTEDIQNRDLVSIVGHEVTAKVLTALLGRDVKFNRATVTLEKGDLLWCIIPNFRSTEAREFTRSEVENAGFRAFKVKVC